MKNLISRPALLSALGLFAFPGSAFASGLETAITAGYYVSSIGFLLATLIMAAAARKFGKSMVGSALPYLTIGTGVFFAVTVFQGLGADFFRISDESMDVWWHLMFYLALASYYLGMKALAKFGAADPATVDPATAGSGKAWGVFTLAALVACFVLPAALEPIVAAYDASAPGQLGLHHFLAFLLAGLVASHLFVTKANFGQIGRAIANPMIVAIGALSLQHFWELLFESWKWVDVTSEVGEGGEKIFLIVAALCVISAARRLRSFAEA